MHATLYDAIDDARPRALSDNLRNLVSGLGTQRDKATAGRFERRFLDPAQLDAMYSGDWIAATAVDAVADDMTREWRSWSGPKAAVARMIEAERAFGVQGKTNRGLKQSRALGGAGILIGDGSSDPSQELDIDAMPKGGLRYLHNLSRYELSCGTVIRDPTSAYFGEPEYYSVAGAIDLGGVNIHPSRVIRFVGVPHLEPSRAVDAWGESVLQRLYDAIRNAAASAQGLASLVQEAKIDVLKIKNLTKNSMDASWRAAMLTRASLANQSKSISGMLLTDAEEEYLQKKVSLADIPEVMLAFLEVCAGAAQIPMTRFLGRSPSGLGSNGVAEIRHYYDTCSSRQETDLRTPMHRLDRVLMRHALGREPDGLTYRWNPLWQLTASEAAAIALQKAQTVQVILATGTIPFAALALGTQSQVVADGVFPGLAAALEVEIAAGRQVTEPPADVGAKTKNPATVNKPTPPA